MRQTVLNNWLRIEDAAQRGRFAAHDRADQYERDPDRIGEAAELTEALSRALLTDRLQRWIGAHARRLLDDIEFDVEDDFLVSFVEMARERLSRNPNR